MPASPGDGDLDGDIDLVDFKRLDACFSGPEGVIEPGCGLFDLDHDLDIDMADVGLFQRAFTGP